MLDLSEEPLRFVASSSFPAASRNTAQFQAKLDLFYASYDVVYCSYITMYPFERAFRQVIMSPNNQLTRAITDYDKVKHGKKMGTLDIVLKGDENQLTGKPLTKRTMQIWGQRGGYFASVIVTKRSPQQTAGIPRGEPVRGSVGRRGS